MVYQISISPQGKYLVVNIRTGQVVYSGSAEKARSIQNGLNIRALHLNR